MEKIEKVETTTHTVLCIKDWALTVWSLDELKKENYFYRVYSRIDGIELIDYDKTNIVPITKDILNRQWTFLEIKLLRVLLILIGLNLLWLVVIGFIVPQNKISLDPVLAEIKKIQTINSATPTVSPSLPVQTTPLTPSTSSPGYNPILPQTTTPNTRKNIPNYAN